MPARRRTGNIGSSSPLSTTSSSANPQSPDKEDEEYRLKRQRNNDAVKKTREKSKKTAKERKQRVEDLKKENGILEGRIAEKKKNIKTLKDILIKRSEATQDSQEMRQIIQNIFSETRDDDNEDSS